MSENQESENQESMLNKYLEDCDWDSAAFLDEADKPPPKVVWQQALALCFRDSKDHRDRKFDDAVEAAAKAVATVGGGEIKARCVRAYAYYLNGNYEQAIAESKRIINSDGQSKEAQPKEADAKMFAHELLVAIYDTLDDPSKMNEGCKDIFKERFAPAGFLPSPLLMDAYRESVKRLNRR